MQSLLCLDCRWETPSHLAADNAVHGAHDGAGRGKSRAEAARAQSSVAVQVPNPAVAWHGTAHVCLRRASNTGGCREACAEVLQVAHVGPLVHAQYVRDASTRGGGVPSQLRKLRAAQDAALCSANDGRLKYAGAVCEAPWCNPSTMACSGELQHGLATLGKR